MSKHHFELYDIRETIAKERGCDPDEVVIDSVELGRGNRELIFDVYVERHP